MVNINFDVMILFHCISWMMHGKSLFASHPLSPRRCSGDNSIMKVDFINPNCNLTLDPGQSQRIDNYKIEINPWKIFAHRLLGA